MRTSEAQRQRQLENNPMPSYRRHDSLRSLAEKLSTHGVRATRADINHLRAALVRSEMIYFGCNRLKASEVARGSSHSEVRSPSSIFVSYPFAALVRYP